MKKSDQFPIFAAGLLAIGSCNPSKERPEEGSLIRDSDLVLTVTPGKWVCPSDEHVRLHFYDDHTCEIESVPLRKGGVFTGRGKYTIEDYGSDNAPSIIVTADDAPSTIVFTMLQAGSGSIQIRYALSTDRHSYLWFEKDLRVLEEDDTREIHPES